MTVTINGTTGIAGVDGSAGTPAVQGADTNTGMFFPAADTIAFAEGGAEVARFDSSGQLGIGTASPAANLHVSSSGNTEVRSATTGANYTTFRLKNSTNDYSMQIRTDVSNAWVLRDEIAAANRLVVDTSGNVIVGGTSTSSNESTYQGGGVFTSRRASSAGTTHANFLNGGSTVGSITSNTTTTFYNTTSDYRLKENATPVTTGLQTIAALNPVNFDWVSNRIADTGFLAHEFQSVIPNCVMGTKDAIDANGNPVYQQIDRSGAIPFLVAAIQEQQALITALTERITALESK
jgi:hypothetical protein